ncbi:MAG: carotenoid oxygenase family protein [Bradymonadaceae bacterium]
MNDVDRRRFLELLGLGSVGASMPSAVVGCGGSRPSDDSPPLADTGPQLPLRTPNSLMSASREEFEFELEVLSGRVPRDAYGHVFTVCSLPFDDGAPIFTGDGMIFRIDFGDGRPRLRARISKTPSWYVDQQTRDRESGFSNRGFVRLSSKWGMRNFANTAFVRMGDRVLATFDAGRPFEIDPKTLEIVTPVGRREEWKSALPEGLSTGPFRLHFSTAHPYYDDRTGQLFSINYRGAMFGDDKTFTDLVRWDGEGELERWSLERPDGTPVEIHQIGVTEDYIIVMDTALNIEQEQFSNPSYVEAQLPDTSIYIVRRDDLRSNDSTAGARKVVIPREAAHFVCDYENPDDKITIHLVHSCTADPSEWVREEDRLYNTGERVRAELVGAPQAATDITMVGRHVVDGKRGELVDSKVVYDKTLTWGVSLYTRHATRAPGRHDNIYWVSGGFSDDNLTERMVDVYRDYEYRTVPVDNLPSPGKPGTLFRFDTRQMAFADGYIFPSGRYPGSPTFVPRRGGSGATGGYLVCTVISDDDSRDQSTGDEFWIFDAENLQQGPLCRLAHPKLDMPFTIHTEWMPEVRERTHDYRVTAREDYGSEVEGASEEVRSMFENHVYPHFGG